jgi:EAL domain-containing protein (putative c-di-GMP-specific phosphodiesterase class I)
VAEGIETKEELDYLRNEIKVDFLQGFYLGKPQ